MTTIFSNISNTYHTTTKHETLESHMYIDSYKNPEIKRIIHMYKFTKDTYSSDFLAVKDMLVYKTVDICIDRYIPHRNNIEKTCHIFTSPPSTMYERGEKNQDSMFELVRLAIQRIVEFLYISKHHTLHASKIYRISISHLKKQRAQHIGGTRKVRTENIKYRYSISLRHRFFLWYQIHVRKIQNFSYTIIDDVSSTGSTLVACKYTLLTHLEHIQKKHPHIRFDVEICSLVH